MNLSPISIHSLHLYFYFHSFLFFSIYEIIHNMLKEQLYKAYEDFMAKYSFIGLRENLRLEQIGETQAFVAN